MMTDIHALIMMTDIHESVTMKVIPAADTAVAEAVAAAVHPSLLLQDAMLAKYVRHITKEHSMTEHSSTLPTTEENRLNSLAVQAR